MNETFKSNDGLPEGTEMTFEQEVRLSGRELMKKDVARILSEHWFSLKKAHDEGKLPKKYGGGAPAMVSGDDHFATRSGVDTEQPGNWITPYED